MRGHFVGIAVIHLLMGGLGLLVWAFFALVGLGVVGAAATEDPAGSFFAGSFFAVVLVMTLVLGILPSLVAGWGLLKGNEIGKWTAIILGVLWLTGFPLGTAFGVWTLWALLSEEGARAYRMGL
jgi:hypothetical protein